MKKTTKLAKRVLSVLLALSIVLSFALTSVSAMPVDYTAVGNVITQDFESSNSPIKLIGAESMALSNEKALSGTSSLKLVANSSGVAKVKIDEKIAGNGANSYYLSFWYYTNNSDVNMMDLAGQEGDTVKYSTIKGSNGWIKAIFKITTTSAFSSYLAFGDYGNAGAVIYIDDLEFAKVEDFTAKTNTVPDAATVVRGGTKDFDTDASTGIGVAMGVASGNATKIGVTGEASHWGERSYAIKGNAGNTGNVEFYFHPRLLIPAMDMKGEDNLSTGSYYMSYYVYSPDATITTSAVSTIGSAVAPTTIPQGEWTKVSGMFTVSEANNNKLNSGLFNIAVNGIGENTVYFDDFLFAEISSVEDISLALENVDYNDGSAKVTIKSNIDLKTAVIEELVGATVDSTDVAGTDVTLEVSGLAANSEYRVLLTVRDVFDRLISRYITFKTPMSFAASSIANGATDVLAPVSYIYIDAPAAIEESTVVAENFTITNGASVTAVELKDADTIKVSLDGTLPSTEYKLSVDNVTDAEGTVLKDSITFTTKKSERSYELSFEGEDRETAVPEGFFRVTGGYTNALDTEVYHSGSQAIKINANTLGLGNVKFELYGMKAGHTYRVTFYYKADTDWAGNLTGSEWGTYEAAIISEADANGWKKCQVDITTDAGAFKFGLESFLRKGSSWANTGTLYLDDFTVTQITGTLSQPIITKDGSCVDDISAGAVLELPLKAVAADKTVNAYVVEYDTNMKMISATPYAKTVSATDDVIEITIPDTSNKIKVIIVDGATFKPLYTAYETK